MSKHENRRDTFANAPRAPAPAQRPSWPEERLARATARLATLRYQAHNLAAAGKPNAAVLRDIKRAEIDVGLWQGRIAAEPVVRLTTGALANGPLKETL